MAEIRYSKVAKQDLEQIGDYITMELKNPTAALNTINYIQDSIDRLKETPHIGSPSSSRYENADNYRYLVCVGYLVFYREQGNVVYIDRIMYGKRDYLQLLFGEFPEEED